MFALFNEADTRNAQSLLPRMLINLPWNGY
jgi:hypothetical protein